MLIKCFKNKPFKKEIKDRAVILVSPDEYLCNGSDGLHQ